MIEKLWARRLKVARKVPTFEIKLMRCTEKGEREVVNSFGYTYPIRLLRSRPYDEDDLIDGVIMEDLRQ